EESSNPLEDNIISKLPPYSAVTPTEPIDSLNMRDKHLNTILETESDEFIKYQIRLAKRLLYDNSFPRPPKEIVYDISNADIESFSPSPIPNEDSDSHMEEIDLSFNPDDPMPPSIEEDDDDSPYRPPAKPPDGNAGTLNIKMLGDVSDQKVPIPNLMLTHILNQEKSPDLLSHQGFEAI
nr:hypothetical protein [Tanacetum cinerariifolium]